MNNVTDQESVAQNIQLNAKQDYDLVKRCDKITLSCLRVYNTK